MTTTVEKSVEVNVPIRTAYNQWTQFEEFPRFMGGVREVRQLDDRRMHWVAEIAGVQREWDAKVLEQVPDSKVAWAATEGATNAGAVHFQPVDTDRTMVRLFLEYEPEGFVEKAGDRLHLVERQAESDLERFKAYIESRGVETGGWRGTIDEGRQLGTPGVEYAAGTRGDSGRVDGSGRDTGTGATTPAGAPYPTGAGPDGAHRPL
ncbi:Polyketide cyclase / dehydrase and lipid transport [Micromonospora sp. MW-13]|nr:Polyketide cyclase / dehydrase and lipid transport [Micromonospora sp. MW-13]